MPKLIASSEDQVINIPGPGNFQFSATRFENLGASEYTLVTVALDQSSSVLNFSKDLLNSLKMIINACKKSPRSENLLLRILAFNHDVYELHGFKELKTIDVDNDYKEFKPDGMTALYDATYDAVGATLEFSKRLIANDFINVNGAIYIITDGMDNRSKVTPSDIKNKIEKSRTQEDIESLITILVALQNPSSGSTDSTVTRALTTFHVEADIDQFIDVGNATPQKLAKLANFVSQSISSQSQSLGQGAPSQQLAF